MKLLNAARRLDTLERVLAWGRARGFSLIEVIVQDEFTHDVIVRADDEYLVFDTT